MLDTYLDLKTTFYEIALILSFVGILFHEDSTFCLEVTCFERNRGVSHFHCKISSSGLNLFNSRRLSKSIITKNNQLSLNHQINKLTYVPYNSKQKYTNYKMVSIFNIFHKILHIPIPIILIQLVGLLFSQTGQLYFAFNTTIKCQIRGEIKNLILEMHDWFTRQR